MKVALLGHPVLRQQASQVDLDEIPSTAFQAFLDDLVATMREYDGVGIAAPQVHVSKRVFAMEVQNNPRYPDAPPLPLTIVVNPEIELPHDSVPTVRLGEACLSIPGLRGQVLRHKELILTGLDRFGATLEMQLSGFPARIVQHEVDHLNGRVYLDAMGDLKELAFQREFDRFHV
jgi:peptide deformylase